MVLLDFFNGKADYLSNMEKTNEIIYNMNKELVHRGPDENGIYISKSFALGHNRLSIIDLISGHQPMIRKIGEGEFGIVYNGEIYNMDILRKELEEKGWEFKTTSDTEVILISYIEYGYDFVEKLNGIFSIAIMDSYRNQLILYRDRSGIKPLFYTIVKNELVFASEIKALFEYPGVEKKFNEQCLSSYLAFQYNPLTETFYRGIFQLLPAHYLEFTDNLKLTHYFKFNYNLDDNLKETDALNMLESTLKDSISHHRLADVEMGSFLSGGIDSSYLAANAK